jgi:pSer/pThr/pTyr-binding forkhead associated (FHA) protein
MRPIHPESQSVNALWYQSERPAREVLGSFSCARSMCALASLGVVSPKLDDRTQPVQSGKSLRGDIEVVLRVLEPKTEPSTRKLGVQVVVGSGDGVDLAIDDRTVSRQHAEFSRTPDGVMVRDLGSRTGCFYLDQRFDSMVLSVGACVRLGKALIALEVDPQSLTIPGSSPRARITT